MTSNGSTGRTSVILGGARTPHGRFLGALASLNAVQLGIHTVRAALERVPVNPEHIDEIIVGQVVPAGSGQAVPRQIALSAGLPNRTPGLAINKVCGSSLKAAMLAAAMVRAEDGDLYLTAGVESMSNAPYLDMSGRTGRKYGDAALVDALQRDGLYCQLADWGMGNAAEFIARQFELTRAELDEFAYQSQMKAAAATAAGKFRAEIAPVEIKGRKGSVTAVVDDEPIRADTTPEALAALRPAFEADGIVTAGNAPGLNDGATTLVVSSLAYAEQHGHTPLARIVGYGQAAVDPQWLFYAPVKAIPLALARAGWSMADVDLFELNEAFAAQVLADIKGLAQDGHVLPLEKLNVHGGAIALGHPVGASGARVLLTLLHALRDRGLKRGVAALCLGGAEAVAMAVEMWE
ncbi:MAG: acetyl-CoA C-acyltransferase [Anaerolineae bacterium]|nr:acetyl-CoA C-acyltransferase [Anaerolineae bacterium]